MTPAARPGRRAVALLAAALAGTATLLGAAPAMASPTVRPAGVSTPGVTSPGVTSPGVTSPADAHPTPAGSSQAAEVAPGTSKVVLVGTAGLRWDDIGTLVTPTLWSLSRTGAVGVTVVRSVRASACPADGWLAVSAGNRAAGPLTPDGSCRTLRDPGADGAVPDWSQLRDTVAAQSYDAQLGVLGDTLRRGGVTAAGIGPGAAIALAAADGTTVGPTVPLPTSPAQLRRDVTTALDGADLVVVDVGALRDPGYATRSAPDGAAPAGAADLTRDPGAEVVIDPSRSEQARTIDARVRAVLDAAGATRGDVSLLVVSLADSDRRPFLQLAAVTGPLARSTDSTTDGLLASRSTRQPGYLQATDVAPTLLEALGVRDLAPAGRLVGAPVTAVAGPPTAAARVQTLLDAQLHAQVTRPLVARFYVLYVLLNLLLYAFVTVGLDGRALARWRRVLDGRWGARRGLLAATADPHRVLEALRVTGVAVAAVPVASFLANLLPWWRMQPAGWALAAATVTWVVLVTALALVPLWRHWLLGPLGVVAAVTTVVIAADVATGARLQLSAVMGTQPLVAGRFYGFNNTAFTLVATASLLLAAALANPLVVRGQRRAAAGVVAALGLVVVLLDGLPSVGADFGGPPALVPGFALLALLAGGVRLTWRRVLGVLTAGGLAVAGFAVLDWTRPQDQRTHLGGFVDTVLSGGLWPVVSRKLQQNLHNLVGSELTVLAVGGLVVLLLVLGRPLRAAVGAADGGPYGWLSGGAPLARLGTDAPMLHHSLVALAVTLGIGFAINDSGIAIPANGIAILVPLLVAATANWMLLLRPGRSVSRSPDAA